MVEGQNLTNVTKGLTLVFNLLIDNFNLGYIFLIGKD
jgi:hypothetical protein